MPDPKPLVHTQEVLHLLRTMTGDYRFEEMYDAARKGEIGNMCEILDQIENRGREIGIQQGIQQGMQQGIEWGEEKSFLLIEKLCSFGMFDDIKKISTDKEYRHQLMRQMGIE